MEAFMIYLLKASGILVLFYVFYQAFLKNETFFRANRNFLLTGVIAAFICPLIVINNYVEIVATPLTIADSLAVNSSYEIGKPQFNWLNILYVVYGLGLLMLVFRFIFQLFAIRKVINSNRIIKKDGNVFVETDKDIAPFSFFRYIIYNPNKFDTLELEAILKHERAHSSQQHSLDLLIAHFVTIILWANPFSWLYKKNIEQNLEFLADDTAIQSVVSDKAYKYALLKVSGNQFFTPITNNFYSSLIKKRIVMLHKSKSNKRNAWKMVLILPALAIFLLSFNTRTIYTPKSDDSFISAENQKTIEILINKDTTNEELEEIKKELSAKELDFSYTVVHNENKEIINIEIDMRSKKKDGKKFSSSAEFDNDGKPIDPITLVYNGDDNLFFMGDSKSKHKVLHEKTNVHTWVYSDDDDDRHIEIKNINGKEIIIVKGKEVTHETIEEMRVDDEIYEKHVRIMKSSSDEKDANVFILKDSDDDNDIEVISEEGNSFFFIDTDEEDPLYIIDGKESSKKKLKSLAPEEIETINVFKGDKAFEKYGKKAKNGVIEVHTKKGN
ncbi:M56 family metallopeptidase [uncultured Eudoraea sp.]|uniref:M56 family metallopeptidase n=1 Tax=uncultured Eudoraea sp. TaxID=1035614 RepID=UPI0026050188|nr:M56 family metallopeptidase [uncultured Eudoraea sp.]